MKLKSIEIANFKAFGKEFQTVPIKPITLVVGSNGATSDRGVKVTISRLSRKDLDNLQQEFAQNSTSHRLQRKFVIV